LAKASGISIISEAADDLFFSKKVFFFSRRNFLKSIYRTPTQFPGGLKSKKNSSRYLGRLEIVKDFLKEHLKFFRRERAA